MPHFFDENVLQHPSTPLDSEDPKTFVDGVLHEIFVPFIEDLMHFGWDCEDETFQQDFNALVELARGVLYRRFKMEHPCTTYMDEHRNTVDK